MLVEEVMIPLIGKSVYNQLRTVRRGMVKAGLQDLAQVFVPVGQAATSDSPFRLLFIGRATKGWKAMPANFDRAFTELGEIVSRHLMKPGTSKFWQFVLRVTSSSTVDLRIGGNRPKPSASGWVLEPSENWVGCSRSNRPRSDAYLPTRRLHQGAEG